MRAVETGVWRRLLVLVCACASTIAGCATGDMSREKSGTVVGAGIGAAIGASVSSDDDKVKGALIGALVGGILGNRVGAMLDERDRLALQDKVLDVAATGATGDPFTWYSEHSGASAVITPAGDARTEKKSFSVRQKTDVLVDGATLEQVTGRRVVTRPLNLRSGPGTAFEVRQVLRQGDEYGVLGKTRNDWYLLSRNEVAIGYASGAFLATPGEGSQPVKFSDRPEQPLDAKSAANEPPNRPRVQTTEANLTITRVCRAVTIKVRDPDGRVTEEEADTCQGDDGSWGA